MGRRRRRSDVAQITADAAAIANALPWQVSLFFGAVLFCLCYWVIPAIILAQLGDGASPLIRNVVEILLQRRVHWFEYLGIALALIFGGYALWNYFGGYRIERDTERGTGLWSRLLARWID